MEQGNLVTWNGIPREIVVSGISVLGALTGLAVSEATQIDRTKAMLFGGFLGTVVGVYMVKERN